MRIGSTSLAAEGFAHGFSLRTGGVSQAPFDTLNFARNVGDDPVAVAENHRRFAEACGYDPAGLFETSQVHGRDVKSVAEGDEPEDMRALEADALITGAPGRAVGIRVADCVPILLGDRRTGAVCAVHAGWKGLVNGIVHAALDELVKQNRQPSDLIAFVGPHIRVCCFDVGDDVARQLAAASPGAQVVSREGTKTRVDLTAIARAQLKAKRVGVIEDSGGCTACEPGRFFSFRRDGARSGRHLAAIAARSNG